MTKLGKFWTGAVAYVSLLVAAGVSMAGNLADTYRTRGGQVDGLDKTLAIIWPLFVILAIEMFVSPRWKKTRMFQAWRWVGCLGIGGMAMTASWTHLHDLMASRGQLPIVSILGPLAIDGMAIMATGLILSTRVRGHVAMPDPDVRVRADLSAADMATLDNSFRAASADDYSRGRWADLVTQTPADTDTAGTVPADTDAVHGQVADTSPLMEWVTGHERARADIAEELATEAQQLLAMTADTLPKRTTVRRTSVPQEFLDRVAAWDGQHPPRPDMVKLTAEQHGVSTRTARRWLAAALGEPVSGPPADAGDNPEG